MLVFRIIATVLMGYSMISCFAKDLMIIGGDGNDTLLKTLFWSMIWRAFVIVALWLI